MCVVANDENQKTSKDPFLCVTQKKLDSLDLADSIDQTLFPSVLRPAVRSEIKQESECKARVKKSKKDHRIFENKIHDMHIPLHTYMLCHEEE